jgi:hypothetical protein
MISLELEHYKVRLRQSPRLRYRLLRSVFRLAGAVTLLATAAISFAGRAARTSAAYAARSAARQRVLVVAAIRHARILISDTKHHP